MSVTYIINVITIVVIITLCVYLSSTLFLYLVYKNSTDFQIGNLLVELYNITIKYNLSQLQSTHIHVNMGKRMSHLSDIFVQKLCAAILPPFL